MSSPLISVVTPAYNEAEYIESTLDSVERQHYENVEHVVVDDGSTDETPAILREYDGSALRWRSTENRGQTAALQTGFELADGDLVVWLNADDVLFDRSALDTVADAFDPDIDVLYGPHAVIDAADRIDHFHIPVPWFDHDRLKRWCFAAFVFFDADLLDRFELDSSYDYAMDYELYLRLADAGATFEYVDRPLIGYRRHDDTKSVRGAEAMAAERRRCQAAYGQEFGWEYSVGRLADGVLHRLLQGYGLRSVLAYHGATDRLAFDGDHRRLSAGVLSQLATVL